MFLVDSEWMVVRSASTATALVVDHTSFTQQGTLKYTVNTNEVYSIDLEATIQVSAGITGVNPHVFIDPVISLDPSVTGSYSLLLSSGVGNSPFSTTGTPEPGYSGQ
jgi:hypothetical protein